MNRIQSAFCAVYAAWLMLAIAPVAATYAADKDCWADFFEDSQYEGRHLRLQGPASLASLKTVNGQSWDLSIDSIKVGPKASVTVYEHPNFKLTLTEMAKFPELMKALNVTEQDIKEDSELIFGPGKNVHSLADYNFHDKVRSLKVECK